MKTSIRRGTLAIGVAFIAFLGTACGSSDDGASKDTGNSGATSEAPAAADSTSSEAPAMADPAADLVGPGCAGYAKEVPDGAGSVAGMAQDPVAVAASNNPLLKTLVAAVSGKLNPKVNLVDTLNGGEFTVFAPVDAAFAKIPAATIDSLKTDDALLTKILTYHVVAGQLSPDQVVGQQATVEKGMVDVTGSGNSLKVNGANVICGGVHTANATVYLIDSVLMPKA
jgi:uncharacterized surface protein with fasciclin (FAS1) repeats